MSRCWGILVGSYSLSCFFFSSRRRHTIFDCDWSSDVCSSDLSEDEFLDAPVQNFGDVEVVFGGAGDFVNPAELAELLAGFAEDAENFSVEREFEIGRASCRERV